MSEIRFELPPDALEQIAQRAAEILAERVPAAAPVSPFLSVEEAADFLRAKPQRVYDLLSDGRLTRHKDGARVLVRRAELDAYLECR